MTPRAAQPEAQGPPTAPAPTVAVLVADDSSVFRRAARAIVDATPGFEVVGEAESGEEAVRLAGERAPALVLLDISMPGLGGIEAARQIVGTCTRVTVVLVTAMAPDEVPAAAQSSGAAAIVPKQDLRPSTLRSLWEAHRLPA